MPQPTTLFESKKPMAQVIALDSRTLEQTSSNEKRLRILQLSDMLSRNLEIEQIIQVFANDVQNELQISGYSYEYADLDLSITQGETRIHRANYRLMIESRELGEITFFRGVKFATDELSNLEDLLCALIYPVQNAVMYQVALKSAYSDPLTGLNNRTAMEKLLPREIELANRHTHNMALLVMDLDGFKEINDLCGHDAGDEVLRHVGRVLREAVRSTDLLYRYGGDEFVGGLAQTDINGALEVSERIRRGIEALSHASSWNVGIIEVSIGITMLRADDSFSNAFKRDDRALYRAKQAGKNQIIVI
ncbi:MAG: GGDEF domain-containing protein [Gammaproteobacteria bacterium]|nr:GGDEF domain-containing protein [Gammaproteobacteria bacterium]